MDGLTSRPDVVCQDPVANGMINQMPDWVTKVANSMGSSKKHDEPFQLLQIGKEDITSEALFEDLSNRTGVAADYQHICDFDKSYYLLDKLSEIVTLDLPKVYECDNKANPLGVYQNEQLPTDPHCKEKVLEEVKKTVETCRQKSLATKDRCEATIYLNTIKFLQLLMRIMFRQGVGSRDGIVEDLFRSFCAVADVDLCSGQWYESKTSIFGLNITSQPDLRLMAPVSHLFDPAVESTAHAVSSISGTCTAIVEVKKEHSQRTTSGPSQHVSFFGATSVDSTYTRPPGSSYFEPCHAQLLGSMLSEIKNTAGSTEDGKTIIGIALDSTKVAILLLQLDHDHLEQMEKNERDTFQEQDFSSKSICYFSEALDMTRREDRGILWKLLKSISGLLPAHNYRQNLTVNLK